MTCICGDPNCTIPYGYCHCGCGKRTNIVKSTNRHLGRIKGQPMLYATCHHPRVPVQTMYTIDPDSGCWVWHSTKKEGGYGIIRRHGRVIPAHRYVYELHRGPIPDGLVIDHLCRNPSCVNPDHLEPVPLRENVRRGIQTKLSWPIVDEIRRLGASGTLSRRAIGRKFGISVNTVISILTQKMWRDEWRYGDNTNMSP